jgi:hypothetical protein
MRSAAARERQLMDPKWDEDQPIYRQLRNGMKTSRFIVNFAIAWWR